MTEEYVGELFSRISKLNYTNHIYVKKTVQLASVCALALLCGYFLHFLPRDSTNDIYSVLYAHFCRFFDGSGVLDCVRSTAYFAMHDIIPMIAVTLGGYTMLSGVIGKIILTVYSAELGFCGAFIYDFLIAKPQITGSFGAFALFTLCKLSVVISLVFAAIRSEDFSYRFSELFSKARHPLLEDQSKIYLKTMISTAGFTAIINTLYLVFQSLSNLTQL